MRRVIETSEVLGVVATPEGERELCASADASFDEAAGKLTVRLDSFLRTTDLRAREEQFSAPWLPKPQVVTEAVDLDEAADLARDVFHRWVEKLRRTIASQPSRTCEP